MKKSIDYSKDSPVMSLKEAATYCHVSEGFLYKWKNKPENQEAIIRVGRQFMIKKDIIDKIIAEREVF